MNRKNLVLQSVSSATVKSIPIEETLEEALIDLYLSVKIRSNDEVSSLVFEAGRLMCMMKICSNRREKSYVTQIHLQFWST